MAQAPIDRIVSDQIEDIDCFVGHLPIHLFANSWIRFVRLPSCAIRSIGKWIRGLRRATCQSASPTEQSILPLFSCGKTGQSIGCIPHVALCEITDDIESLSSRPRQAEDHNSVSPKNGEYLAPLA